jgi:hypothetical protein
LVVGHTDRFAVSFSVLEQVVDANDQKWGAPSVVLQLGRKPRLCADFAALTRFLVKTLRPECGMVSRRGPSVPFKADEIEELIKPSLARARGYTDQAEASVE